MKRVANFKDNNSGYVENLYKMGDGSYCRVVRMMKGNYYKIYTNHNMVGLKEYDDECIGVVDILREAEAIVRDYGKTL